MVGLVQEAGETAEGDQESPNQGQDQAPDQNKGRPDTAELAAKEGHQAYEDYIARGGKPELYKSPEVFMALKEPMKAIKEQSKRLKRQEQEFQERMNSMTTMHAAQLKAQKADLLAKRNEKINDLDAEGAQAIQNQIDNLPPEPEAPQQQAPQQSDAIREWSENNKWIDKPGAKSVYAQSQFSRYMQSGYSDVQALEAMENDIKREFPDVNRTPVTTHEGGTPPGLKPAKSDPTMQNLTPDEANTWKHSSSMWGGDQKKFLKSVKASRDAQNV